MTLQKKVLLTIGVTIVCLIIILFVISQIFILSSFSELEEQNTRQNVERVMIALSDEVSAMDVTCNDWAAWDDTYAFIEDRNEEYIESNLVDGTFTDLGLNFMLFINTSGQIVFGKAMDLQNEEEIPVPQSFLEHLSPNAPIINPPDVESSITGIVLLPAPEDPVLIASRPIITSEDEGPIRGTLIMGRYLDTAEIENLAELTQLSLSVHRFDDSQMPSDLQAAESYLSEDDPIFIQPLNEESIAGYALIEDIYGRPSLVLKADMPRSIYRQGQTTVNYFILFILSIGLVFSVLILLFLDRSVLTPLSQLSDSVGSIGTSGDPSKRVSMPGRDEFTNLADSVNGMLESLEQSQHKLQESEEKYRSFFKTSRDSVFITSKDGRWLDMNDAAVELLGYESKDELFNVRIPDLYEAPEERERHTKIIGQQGFAKEFPVNLRKKDGSIINTLITSVVKKDVNGNVIGYQGTIRDITERKRADEERERILNELEIKNAEMERFVYTVSHDLRSPLITIQGFTGMIQKDLEQNKVGKAADNLTFIDKAAAKMEKLLGETLELSRIGRVANPPEDVPFGEIVEEALEQTAAQIKSSGVEVTVAEDFPTVHVDRMRIAEVLVNLIENSMNYMGEQLQPRIEIGHRAEGESKETVFFVKDNGIGMDKSQHEKVFELFYQIERNIKGTGAGLAIVKRIIEVHNGRIWIESEMGKGSTISFTLPVV